MYFGEENLICRFCLKKKTENCESIDEIHQHSLNFLTLCTNLTISDDPIICETCAGNLKKCFDFKARCLSTEDCIASFAEGEDKIIDLRDIYSKVKLDGNIDEVPDYHSVCRFCLGLVKDDASTSVKHDKDLIVILQKYFPEMDLRITYDIIACAPCYDSLQLHDSFVNNYLNVEGKINEYCRVEGVNHKGQVDLRGVVTFISKSMLNVENISSLIIKEEKYENIINTSVDVDVKFEDATGVKQEKEKFVDKEIQQENDNSFQHQPSASQSDCVPPLIWTHVLADKDKVQEVKYNCELCPFKTKTKDCLKKHILTHTHTEVTTYKCDLCDYEAKCKSLLKNHLLTHRTHSDMYKCDMCEYETKQKGNLKRHMLTHKTRSEISMYKCYHCHYETKRKPNLQRHMLTHKTASETTMYKCEACTYETKHKNCLQQHRLIHTDVSETKMYKCEWCAFETKWNGSFRNHVLAHSNTPHIETMHKCDLCNYEAKRKSDLEGHMLIHKTNSEITMYKCGLCNYEAKRKTTLRRHMLTHRTRSEVTMYICEVCAYETIRNDILQQHMLSHMDVSEIVMYKCEVCPYETKWNGSFRKHLISHKKKSRCRDM